MSDRIAIMDAGRIAQMGPPREVYERPDNTFVARFLGEANLLPARADAGVLRGPGGTVLPLDAPARDGQVFVRPEKLALHDGGADVGIPGTVRHMAFLGNVVRYEVTLPEGHIVLADLANAPGAELRPVGSAVRVSWRPEDGRLLEA